MGISGRHGYSSELLMFFDIIMACITTAIQDNDLCGEQMMIEFRAANNFLEFIYRLRTGNGLQ